MGTIFNITVCHSSFGRASAYQTGYPCPFSTTMLERKYYQIINKITKSTNDINYIIFKNSNFNWTFDIVHITGTCPVYPI